MLCRRFTRRRACMRIDPCIPVMRCSSQGSVSAIPRRLHLGTRVSAARRGVYRRTPHAPQRVRDSVHALMASQLHRTPQRTRGLTNTSLGDVQQRHAQHSPQSSCPRPHYTMQPPTLQDESLWPHETPQTLVQREWSSRGVVWRTPLLWGASSTGTGTGAEVFNRRSRTGCGPGA